MITLTDLMTWDNDKECGLFFNVISYECFFGGNCPDMNFDWYVIINQHLLLINQPPDHVKKKMRETTFRETVLFTAVVDMPTVRHEMNMIVAESF